jgi:glycosyltransferase involved in cell wall biosynthesis
MIIPSHGCNSADSTNIRVAVICDFLEERWPSMDLVGDMLCCNLADQCHDDLTAVQVRPPLPRRLSRIPGLPERSAWNADRLIGRFVDYPRWLRSRQSHYDLFHLVDHSYSQLINGLAAGRVVVTCHDLDTFRCLLEPDREKRPRWFRAMSSRILRGFQKAAHVIAVSEATRSELLRNDLLPPERITVVRNGVHPSCSPLPEPAADAAAAALFSESRNDTALLLNVGSTIPRKRLDVLLRVFATIAREVPQARLLRVGGPFTPAQARLAQELNVGHAVTTLPFLERDILAAVYRRATVLLHTAEAEGFGLPLIEAMACGCPVVASDVPVLREVGGTAATYCEVAGVQTWKDTVLDLLQEKMQRASAWEMRKQRGVTQAARFSWAENARQTARIYRKVLECK